MYKMTNKNFDLRTATPKKYPQGYFKDKGCRMCGTPFKPIAPSAHYCSQSCADRGLANAYLLRTYKITLVEYERLLQDQGNLCALCNSEGFLMTPLHKCKLVVDHDHVTGKVRGLLCHNCNRALGLLKDNLFTINKVIEYLKVQRPSLGE